MGRFSDLDILDRHGQSLAAVRLRVKERLDYLRRRQEELYGTGTLTRDEITARVALKVVIEELEPLARMLGVEA